MADQKGTILRFLALCVALMAAPFAVSAQSWQFAQVDNGFRIYAGATAGVGLDFRCNAPSPQGRDAVSADAHEDTLTGPDQMLVEIGSERVAPNNAGQRDDIVLWLDQTSYRLPLVHWNELNSVWELFLGTGDPVFAAMASAQVMILAPGSDGAWQFPTDGLGDAIARTVDTCAGAWAAASQSPATPQALRPQALPIDRALAHIADVCGGGHTQNAPAFLTGLIDGDQTPDVLVWWGEISCQSGLARPLCGASHCSANLFLSSRSGSEDFLAQTAELVPLSNGRIGLSLAGRFDSCGADSLGCQTIWYWNGATMSQLQ